MLYLQYLGDKFHVLCRIGRFQILQILLLRRCKNFGKLNHISRPKCCNFHFNDNIANYVSGSAIAITRLQFS